MRWRCCHMPAFVWKEKSYVGVNHFLAGDHHEDNMADFSSHSFVLLQVLPLAYFFLTLFFKGSSGSNPYRGVKFVSRNAVLGNRHIKIFSCKISCRCRMWEKCCPEDSLRMVVCVPYELIPSAHCRAWPMGTCLPIALFGSVIWHADKACAAFQLI